MSKVTVVGAGNVGATCANVLAVKKVASEVVLIDIKEGVAEGKAMDIMQTAQLLGQAGTRFLPILIRVMLRCIPILSTILRLVSQHSV